MLRAAATTQPVRCRNQLVKKLTLTGHVRAGCNVLSAASDTVRDNGSNARDAMDFDEFVRTATGGKRPYPYQCRLAAEGLPDVLCVPTGAGKTLAATLPWLYRRHCGEEPTRWLVLVLPQRVLVEQTVHEVESWLTALSGVLHNEVSVHVLMGGESRRDQDWRIDPHRSRIFVGTQDMVLSRLLMRGFAETRAMWPVSFGLFHSGTQFVFDEVQLMGPGLRTSLQLQGLREAMKTALPCRSMWMSATLTPSALRSVDFDRSLRVDRLRDEDTAGGEDGELGRRLAATRRVARIDLDGAADARKYATALADRVVAAHRHGTRTLVVLNTVDRAIELFRAVKKLAQAADVVLLHSRFRPGDRRTHTDRAVTGTSEAGDIVVSTQVLEAGVDITSSTLITELAPWSSIVQRAGRCNRDGRAVDARLMWVVPPPGKGSSLPYEQIELDNSAAILTELEGQLVTSTQLIDQGSDVGEVIHPTLRRRDLRDLFDTAADLNGNDIDVGPYIRDADERTVFVAWRALPLSDDMGVPDGEELCPAPLAGVRALLKRSSAVVFDQNEGQWRAAQISDVRPTAMLVFDAARGGYGSEFGFDPSSRSRVDPVEVSAERPDSMDTDPQSMGCPDWLSLADHLADTEAEARRLLVALAPELPDAQQEAIVAAARWHDLGKAHPTYQTSLLKANPELPPPDTEAVWAKSPGTAPLRHDPPHFRHELVSALLLLDQSVGLLMNTNETDLIVYLALAHHGKIRLAVRAAAGEPANTVRGVRDGAATLPVALPGGQSLPSRELSLAPTRIGVGSLTDRALRLRDRADLGPFRLAFCEAIVRCADWKASKEPGGGRA
jgi:CRISPR-associated endonuclease/helicase Cas3